MPNPILTLSWLRAWGCRIPFRFRYNEILLQKSRGFGNSNSVSGILSPCLNPGWEDELISFQVFVESMSGIC